MILQALAPGKFPSGPKALTWSKLAGSKFRSVNEQVSEFSGLTFCHRTMSIEAGFTAREWHQKLGC